MKPADCIVETATRFVEEGIAKHGICAETAAELRRGRDKFYAGYCQHWCKHQAGDTTCRAQAIISAGGVVRP